MKGLLATLVGLAIVTLSNPATAYLVNVTTSIPVTSTRDDAQLRHAVESAVDDVLNGAIGFVPTVVTVQDARVIGNRIYILLLIADEDGEETMKRLFAGESAGNESPVEKEPGGEARNQPFGL